MPKRLGFPNEKLILILPKAISYDNCYMEIQYPCKAVKALFDMGKNSLTQFFNGYLVTTQLFTGEGLPLHTVNARNNFKDIETPSAMQGRINPSTWIQNISWHSSLLCSNVNMFSSSVLLKSSCSLLFPAQHPILGKEKLLSQLVVFNFFLNGLDISLSLRT